MSIPRLGFRLNGGFVYYCQNTLKFSQTVLPAGEPNELVGSAGQRLTLVLLNTEGYKVGVCNNSNISVTVSKTEVRILDLYMYHFLDSAKLPVDAFELSSMLDSSFGNRE